MTKDNTVLVTKVWWDLNACPPPKGCDYDMIPSYITHALHCMGFSTLCIRAYGSSGPLNDELLDERVLESLKRTAAYIECFGKGASSMKHGLNIWSGENILPANHLIITRDFNFYQSEVIALQKPGCSILLAYPDHDEKAASCAANFVPTPKHVWKLSQLLCGGPPDGCEVDIVSTPLEDGEVEFPCPDVPIQSSFCGCLSAPAPPSPGYEYEYLVHEGDSDYETKEDEDYETKTEHKHKRCPTCNSVIAT